MRAKEINDEMKIAAAYAIAGLVKEDELCPEFIIPNPLNKEVAPAVANAVKEAARKTGQIPVATIEEAWQLAQEKLKAEGKTDYTINVMQHAANTVPMIEE